MRSLGPPADDFLALRFQAPEVPPGEAEFTGRLNDAVNVNPESTTIVTTVASGPCIHASASLRPDLVAEGMVARLAVLVVELIRPPVLPVGLTDSSFATTRAQPRGTMRRSSTTGVLPMRSMTLARSGIVALQE
jgi:hypothetical protein